MIGRHWSNQYCYSRLILENYIKITKIKIMRWEADKRWLYEWCNDYRTIEYEVVINEKSSVIELKPKCFNDVSFAVVQPQNSRFFNIYFGSMQANLVWRKMRENREKSIFVISRNKRKLSHWFIIQSYWDWLKKSMPF